MLLIIPILIVSIPLFSHSGTIFTQDYPTLDTSSYSEDRLWLWVEETSSSGFENLSRFTIIGIWYILSFASINSEIASKFMIIIGFSLGSFSFYGAFYYLLRNKFKESSLKFKIALLLGSIFFAYNIWSFNRISHYYLWLGYALLPIFLVAVLYSLERSSKIKYTFIAALSWTFASSTPHMMVYYTIILGLICLWHFFISFKNDNILKTLLSKFSSVVLLLVFFIVLNLFWLVPYFLTYYYSSSLAGPTYLLNIEIIDIVSRANDFVNTIRLSADWITFEQNLAPNSGSLLYYFWSIQGFIFISIFVASSILWFRKIKYSIFFFLLGILGIILAMGTYFPIDYWGILFSLPLISSYLWVFRDPDKWSFLISTSYSFMIILFSLSVFKLFVNNKRKNYIVSISFSIFFIVIIIIHSYTIFNHSMYQKFSPILLPVDFDNLNSYLDKLNPMKVFYLPFLSDPPYWSANHSIGSIYNFKSDIPSIEISSPDQKKYYNYFNNLVYNNQTKYIGNFIYPFGTSYLIYHNDIQLEPEQENLLDYYEKMEDIIKINSVGFYDIFKTRYEQSPVSIANQKIGIIGGLENFEILNNINSFNTINSSLLFLNQHPYDASLIKNFDMLIIPTSTLNFISSFIPNQYLLSPIDNTFHNEKSTYWSRVSTSDPLHGEFHPYIQNIDIDNWDFDYGKGVVITEAEGAKIESTIEVNESGIYDIFLRYLENIRGGSIKIYLDNIYVDEISTLGKSNKFQWLQLDSQNFTSGKHSLTIENTKGVNAINTVAIVPKKVIEDIIMQINANLKMPNLVYFINPSKDSYLYDANSTRLELFSFRDLDVLNNTNHSTISMTGNVRIPQNAKSIAFEFSSEFSNNNSENPIEKIVMSPNHERNIFVENFEKVSKEFMFHKSTNYTAELEKSKPISGNASLQIDIEKQPVIDKSSPWQIISTDYIDINDNARYGYDFKVETSDIVELHPKIYYFDSNHTLIKEDILAQGDSGSFNKQYSLNIFPPKNTAFITLAYFFLPNAERNSNITLDDISISENLSPIIIDPNNNYEPFSDLSNKISILKNVNANKNISLIRSGIFDVRENTDYSYLIEIDKDHVKSLNSSLVLQSETSLLNEMENNMQLDELGNNSSQNDSVLSTNFGILRNDTYTIMFRLNNYQDNISKIIIDNVERAFEVSKIKDNNHTDIYLPDVDLSIGTHQMDAYFKKMPYIEMISIYSNDKSKNSIDDENNTSLEQLFESSGQHPPAFVNNFTKINPTKYSIAVSNATKPFNLIISESFDPLWTAKIDDYNDSSSIESYPLFSIVNGFYINKTGNFDITIEYAPQKWFEIGSIASIIFLPIILIVSYYISKRRSRRK